MSVLAAVSTYLPPWLDGQGSRRAGDDEDAVTMAVASGVPIVEDIGPAAVREIQLVTRDPVLIAGDQGAALSAGLGVPPSVGVVQRLGGGPDVIDALGTASEGTLVIGVDIGPAAGATATLVAHSGATVTPRAQLRRSLPVTTTWPDGRTFEYDDTRLMRESGIRRSVRDIGLAGAITVLAGANLALQRGFAVEHQLDLPTEGASAPGFALAAMAEGSISGVLASIEAASIAAIDVEHTGDLSVRRDERAPTPLPNFPEPVPATVPISLAAYDRAFDAKLRLVGVRCGACGALAYPPRRFCVECGSDDMSEPCALPRTGTVYSTVTVRVPVPGIRTPYQLAIVELDDSGVRVLAPVTGSIPGTTSIDDRGHLVLRRVRVRTGVPDYGYALLPEAS